MLDRPIQRSVAVARHPPRVPEKYTGLAHDLRRRIANDERGLNAAMDGAAEARAGHG